MKYKNPLVCFKPTNLTRRKLSVEVKLPPPSAEEKSINEPGALKVIVALLAIHVLPR